MLTSPKVFYANKSSQANYFASPKSILLLCIFVYSVSSNANVNVLADRTQNNSEVNFQQIALQGLPSINIQNIFANWHKQYNITTNYIIILHDRNYQSENQTLHQTMRYYSCENKDKLSQCTFLIEQQYNFFYFDNNSREYTNIPQNVLEVQDNKFNISELIQKIIVIFNNGVMDAQQHIFRSMNNGLRNLIQVNQNIYELVILRRTMYNFNIFGLVNSNMYSNLYIIRKLNLHSIKITYSKCFILLNICIDMLQLMENFSHLEDNTIYLICSIYNNNKFYSIINKNISIQQQSNYFILITMILVLLHSLYQSYLSQIQKQQNAIKLLNNKNKINLTILFVLLIACNISNNILTVAADESNINQSSSSLNDKSNFYSINSQSQYNQIIDHQISTAQQMKQQFRSHNVDIIRYILNTSSDTGDCSSSSYPCKTINYVLNLNLPTEFIRGSDKVIINLQSSTYDPNTLSGISPAQNIKLVLLSDSTSDQKLQVNIPTIYQNYITIQSDGYTQDSQSSTNPKYKIPTSLQSNSLFTITDNGHLDLLGLQFSNLNPTSQNPLLYVQSPNLDKTPILFIVDCEFNQEPDSYPDYSLSHCLIHINGGKLTISKTIIKDYQISNGKSSIMIHSDKSSTSGVYRMNQIDIINSTFENIIQAEGSGSGSTINAELKTGSIMNISQSCSFANCKSRTTGGAIQTIISGGQIELNEVIIKGCKARNGGGIYINIDFSSQFEFKIINSLIQDCQAKNDQLQINHTGYGGGIFLTGTGEYNPSTKRLDLKGMKIYGNSADKSGQSLYVAMTSVKEWCKYGIAGEFVKGNYSDRYSQFEDIEGIQVDQTTFNYLSLESIKQQQSVLQYYWAEISNLTKISATLNKSNTNQPLQINLEGQNMIAEQFAVKIVELEQINHPNNLYKIQTHNINENKQPQIKILSKSSSSIFTKSNTNSFNNNKLKLISNYAFEIIYPPDDELALPILIEGDPQIFQSASFGMKDISWIDYDNKPYGILASNDKRIFTGIDGKEDQAYPLEIIIEKDDDGKTTHFPWWIILIIILSPTILIIILLICCICFCWRKYKDQKNIKINYVQYYTNYENHNNETELIPSVEKSTNLYVQNHQQQHSLDEIDQTDYDQLYLLQLSALSNKSQNKNLQQKQPIQINTSDQSLNNNPYINTETSHTQKQITQNQQENYLSNQSQSNSSSSFNLITDPSNNIYVDQDPSKNSNSTVPEDYQTLALSGNNQIIQPLDYQQQLQLQIQATNTNSFIQLKRSKTLSPFQFNESNSQQSDPSLYWQQQIHVSDSEKDIDPPLMKVPSEYFGKEQLHNISNEELTIIKWSSIKKNGIPPFKNNTNKK